jgi:hypothetical protein
LDDGRFSQGVVKPQRNATMVKLPAWDTPTWRLPHELRPFYAAVNRVRDLEITPDVSMAEIAATRRAVAVAAMELARLVDALRLFKAERATVAYFGQA